MRDKKLEKCILEILYQENREVILRDLKSVLIKEYNYSESIKNFVDLFIGKIRHCCSVLESDGYVVIGNGLNNRGHMEVAVSLTAKGYNFFIPWYGKIWKFFTNDMYKILVLISTILSITLMLNEIFDWF